MRYWDRVRQIQSRLGNRRLVYFGTRGTDARPLLNLDLLDAVFSQIAPLQVPGIEEVCLETLKGVRVDLNSYSIDKDDSPEVVELRNQMLQRFGRPAAVLAYRPAALLTAAWFPRADRVAYLGVFHEKQACFEHKPWVESQLEARGVPVIPWTYYSDADRILIKEALGAGPLVLRANHSDGGAGLGILTDSDELDLHWPDHKDGFLAASPLMEPSIPLNVNACVFRGGQVLMHPPSVQLIGLARCTNRILGYCGNDFAAIAQLAKWELRQLESITREAGAWLAREGYVGAFGIDALLYQGTVFLVEVNPRFQGSSVLAAFLMHGVDRPDVYLDHIAACLGVDPGDSMSLSDLALLQAQDPVSHVIAYNTKGKALRLSREVPTIDLPDCSLVADSSTKIEPEAILVEWTVHSAITMDGKTLEPARSHSLAELLRKTTSLTQ